MFIPSHRRRLMRALAAVVVAACWVAAAVGPLGARADTVLPLDPILGLGDNTLPFQAGPVRYQQFYDPQWFRAPDNPPVTIYGLGFRVYRGFHDPLNLSIADIQIRMGTSSGNADGTNGPGPFATLASGGTSVLDRGRLTLTSPAHAGIGPNPFDVVIFFNHPFTYDAAGGCNLVLEVRKYSGESSPVGFEAAYYNGDGTGRAFAFDPNATTAADGDTLGLITKFITTDPAAATPLPAAATGGIMLMGGIAISCRPRRRASLPHAA
ncbi:MAG: putative rane protein [Phycisphaerales bacterium]|nr:putative rane protein [Phycisphaerales bacterium]